MMWYRTTTGQSTKFRTGDRFVPRSDLDAIVGEYYGNLNYYKNTGTATAPAYTEQTGTDNPFDVITEFRLADGIAGNADFGTGGLLVRLQGVTGFGVGDVGQ